MRRTNQFLQANYLIPNTTIVGNHPMKQFDCGSKENLLPQGLELTVAVENLKAACHDFVQRNYTGANMSLVLQVRATESIQNLWSQALGCLPIRFSQAPEELDILQEIVLSTFGQIPAGLPLRRELAPSPPYAMSLFNSLYIVKPPRSNKHEVGSINSCQSLINPHLIFILASDPMGPPSCSRF